MLENIEFDLHESLSNTLKTFSASANEKGLELVYQVAPDIPIWVTGDPGRLAQIVINIVGNAIKFTQQGEVALRVVQDSRTSDCCLLYFSVSDTGIGISEQQQGHIFDAFTQADSSTTRQFGGTGLGLAIVSQLIKLMGGEIWVESESGKGTIFHFTAQFGLPANPPLNTIASQVSALKNLPVLVVDDNATIRLVLAEILSSWHMRPTLAESGQQGLDELSGAAKAGTPFKLVLLDAHMPGFDGYQLIEAIQTMPARNSSTVMMLASNDIPAEVARCETLGIKRILTKPIKPSELFDAIMMVTGLVGNDEGLIDVKQIAISEKPSHLLRVLVAEDHPINQKLVIEILRERGHTFAIANNGKEVLQMLVQQVFDVILMDGQMPEMDGYEATREIRRREQATGQHMRIIAVTANAMKGDREVCLAEGMDDYLSKPIDSDQLLEKLEQGDGITNAAISENQDAEEVTTHTGKVFDVESALKRMRGKEVLLKQMVQIFLNDLPASLVEIEAAISNNDMQLKERAAHKLKGTAATLSAEALAQSAEKIEHFSKNRATNHLPQAMKQLKDCASELMVEMEKYTGVKI